MNLYQYVNIKFRPVHDTRAAHFETLVHLRRNRRSSHGTFNVRVNYENVVINYCKLHFIISTTLRHGILCKYILQQIRIIFIIYKSYKNVCVGWLKSWEFRIFYHLRLEIINPILGKLFLKYFVVFNVKYVKI